jgi:hypothetical protein
MSLCCSNEGGGEVGAEFDAMSFFKKQKVLEERKNYTYAIEATGEVIDVGDPIVDATFLHDCFCVHVIALVNV